MRSVPSVTVSAHAVSGDKHLAGVSVALVFKGRCGPPKHTPTIPIGLPWKQQSFLPTLEEKNGHCSCEQISNMMPSQRASILPHVLTFDANPWV